MARKEFEACLIISAELVSVTRKTACLSFSNRAIGMDRASEGLLDDRFVNPPQQVCSAARVCANHNAIGMQKVSHR